MQCRWLRWVAISAGICLVAGCSSTVSAPDAGELAGSACFGLIGVVPAPFWNQDLSDAKLQKTVAKKVTFVDSNVSLAKAAANWGGAKSDGRYQELASTFETFGSTFDGWAQAVKTLDRTKMASYLAKRAADGSTSSPLTDSYTAAISACQSVGVVFATPPSPAVRSTGT